LSSTDILIGDIETEYKKLLKHVVDSLAQANRTTLTECQAVELFDHLVHFQTFLELKESQTKMFSGVRYYERTADKFSRILEMITGQQTKETADGIPRAGLLLQMKAIVASRRAGYSVHDAVNSLLQLVKDMGLGLIQSFHYLRLMSGLRTVLVEERVSINDKLLKSGFNEAVSFIDDAMTNLQGENPHLKDSLANLRHAVESVLYQLREQAGLKMPSHKTFSVDLSALSQTNPAAYDEATKVMVQTVWSYLSVTGGHIFGKITKDDVELVEFGFDLTYQVLARLLSRLDFPKVAKL
jgi:phosphate uptake regulator